MPVKESVVTTSTFLRRRELPSVALNVTSRCGLPMLFKLQMTVIIDDCLEKKNPTKIIQHGIRIEDSSPVPPVTLFSARTVETRIYHSRDNSMIAVIQRSRSSSRDLSRAPANGKEKRKGRGEC